MNTYISTDSNLSPAVPLKGLSTTEIEIIYKMARIAMKQHRGLIYTMTSKDLSISRDDIESELVCKLLSLIAESSVDMLANYEYMLAALYNFLVSWSRKIQSEKRHADIATDVFSLDALEYDECPAAECISDPRVDNVEDAVIARLCFKEKIASMSEPDLKVFFRLYLAGDSQADIASALGVTQPMVSQRKSQIEKTFVVRC